MRLPWSSELPIFLSDTDFLSKANLVKQMRTLRKNKGEKILLNSLIVYWSCSLNRHSCELIVIMNECTYPILLRSMTILAIWLVSLPFESPNPGVSMIIMGSFLSDPRAWVTNPLTSEVSDSTPAEVMNIFFFSPHSELLVDDLPWPVTPIKHIELNLVESDYALSQQDLN